MNWYKFAKESKVIPFDELFLGKADKENFTEQDVDPEELKMGMGIELEHTHDKSIARKIALDHLAEIPDYYSRLKKMEGDAETQKAAKIETFFMKLGSMSVYVNGFDYPEKINTISDICYYIAKRFFRDIDSVLTPEEMAKWKEEGHPSYDTFSPDGDDYFEPVGIVNTYVKGFPPNKTQWLVNYILKTLKEAKVKVINVIQEPFPDSSEIRVIRFSIGLNPNANEKRDIPEDVNFSNSNAYLVAMLLGAPKEMEGSVALNASTTASEADRLQDFIAFESKLNELGFDQYAEYADSIQKRIQAVGKVAKWAVDHGYQEIYFA